MQPDAVVVGHVPPVHVYEVAAGSQWAVSVAVPPGEIEAGVAVTVQTGGADVATVTVALAVLPAPPPLLPVTEYVVVTVGDTVPVVVELPNPVLADHE